MALWKTPKVAWNGEVGVCCMDVGMALSLGNIKDHTLDEMWMSPKIKEWRLHHIRGEFNKVKGKNPDGSTFSCAKCNGIKFPGISDEEIVKYLKAVGEEKEIEPYLKRVKKEEQYICTRPFSYIEINEDGECSFCCYNWQTKHESLEKKSLKEIWNGPTAQSIREGILNGTFEYCNKSLCPHFKRKSGYVKRISDIKYPAIKEAIINKEVKLSYGPKEINACYDPSCNLCCPSCRLEIKMVQGEQKKKVDMFHKKVIDAMQDTKKLIVTGSGEPFVSPVFRPWLQKMQPKDYPKLEHICLLTNGQLLFKSMWDSLSKIHKLIKSIEIGIDAANPETYAKNRPGGSFEILMGNLRFISTLNIETTLTFTVQNNNFLEMQEFVKLAKEFGMKVMFKVLVNWGTFSDEEYKKRAVHLNTHPKHSEFVEMIHKQDFFESDVQLGNLSKYVRD